MNTAPTLGVITTDRQLHIRSWNEWIASATGLYVLGGGTLALVAFAVWAWGCCALQQ